MESLGFKHDQSWLMASLQYCLTVLSYSNVLLFDRKGFQVLLR